jgi:hypothetical protein
MGEVIRYVPAGKNKVPSTAISEIAACKHINRAGGQPKQPGQAAAGNATASFQTLMHRGDAAESARKL